MGLKKPDTKEIMKVVVIVHLVTILQHRGDRQNNGKTRKQRARDLSTCGWMDVCPSTHPETGLVSITTSMHQVTQNCIIVVFEGLWESLSLTLGFLDGETEAQR